MSEYEIILIVRMRIDAELQIDALKFALSGLPPTITEVLIKEIREIKEEAEE